MELEELLLGEHKFQIEREWNGDGRDEEEEEDVWDEEEEEDEEEWDEEIEEEEY